jgi:hypothetical protein
VRRLELDDDEHALLLDALMRQARALASPRLAALRETIAAAPRVLAYVVTVDVRQTELPLPMPELRGLPERAAERAAFTRNPERRNAIEPPNDDSPPGLAAGHPSSHETGGKRRVAGAAAIEPTKKGGEVEASPPTVHASAQVGVPPRAAAGG